MSYDYSKERAEIFTESGQVHFLKVRDQVKALLATAGAFRMDALRVSGDSWLTLACVDRLIDLNEIAELQRPNAWGQFRVFTSPETNNR